MPSPDACPRCGSTDLHTITGESAGLEWSQRACDDCDHRWGDGLPDEAALPLPEGFGVCPTCGGVGSPPHGLSDCPPCEGRGIIRTALHG